MRALLGPLPCQACRTLVVYAVYERAIGDRERSYVRTRGLLEPATGRVHRCPARAAA